MREREIEKEERARQTTKKKFARIIMILPLCYPLSQLLIRLPSRLPLPQHPFVA